MARFTFLLLCSLSAWASNCLRTSTGLQPFTTPYIRSYSGVPAGLYPNGSTQRPAAHESLGLKQATLILPRDASGNPDDRTGRVVLISMGMSNTSDEYQAFQQLLSRETRSNPHLVTVDGAIDGWSADRVIAAPGDYWTQVDQRVRSAGVSPQQVQAAWLKQADATPNLAFPNDARQLQSELQAIIAQARARFPNLAIVYLSSRIYAGYADSNLNPEPHAYQGAFSVKWLIEQQLNSDPALSTAQFPFLAWGPYLRADGTNSRVDGLSWACSEFQSDGTHPSEDGAFKVGRMLLDFLLTDTTSRSWFLAPPSSVPTPAIGTVVNAASYAPAMATGSIASIFGSNLAGGTYSADTFPLPHSLGGTRVELSGVPAVLYFVSPTQINLVLPAASIDPVVVIREATASKPVPGAAGLWTPGLFTNDGRSLAALHADGSLISLASPAARGETIQIFGTGFGIRNPLLLIPEPLPIVRIGGIDAEITYLGNALVWPGVTQINVVVPLKLPAGASAEVEWRMATIISNTATLAINP